MDNPDLLGSFMDLTIAAAGLVVLLLGYRAASELSFRSQRVALRFLLLAVAIGVLAEAVEGVHGLFLQSMVPQAVIELAVEGPAGLLVMTCVATAIYLVYRSNKGEVASLRRLAVTDTLTNLSNQHFFRRAASRRFENFVRQGSPLACLMLDVDEFKAYNDRFGHEAGNAVLQCVARVLRESVRADDLVSRYGGDEFAELINSSLEEAVYVAERIREGVETHCTPGRDPSLFRPVTISVGVAVPSSSTRTLENLVEAADKELYRAKRAGKNGVSATGDWESTGTE
jgi:diguanylate cyclase (GGDEF)-like protein